MVPFELHVIKPEFPSTCRFARSQAPGGRPAGRRFHAGDIAAYEGLKFLTCAWLLSNHNAYPIVGINLRRAIGIAALQGVQRPLILSDNLLARLLHRIGGGPKQRWNQ
jgi:hypothetical protein